MTRNDSNAPGGGSLALSKFRLTVEICDRFELAWRSGEEPTIEEFLDSASPLVRTPLLRKLLELELELRHDKDEIPTYDDYLSRFPAESRLIHSIFEEATATSPRPHNSPLMPPHRSLHQVEPGSLIAHFELLELLGQGGMGAVYRARDQKSERTVALKVIKPTLLDGLPLKLREDLVQRFVIEAKATAQLQHLHIVTVFEVGAADDRHFYSMEYVEGQSLAQILQGGPFTSRRAAMYLEPVALAVHHAHTRGILHRDLKPTNILIDGDDRPLVTDFGLAKWISNADRVTVSGDVLGTPSYMSPEQARGSSDVCIQSDVYSLGATLYELLTGRPPFKGGEPLETLLRVLNEEPVAPRQINPGVARDLETICLKCLRKEIAARYGTAQELAEDLRRFLSGEPIRARSVGFFERGVKWLRRHPWAAAILTISFVSLGLFITGLIWRDRRDNIATVLLVGDLQSADISGVTRVIERLQAVYPREISYLDAIVQEPEIDIKRRNRAELGLLPHRPELGEAIFQRMLIANAQEQGVLGKLLHSYWPEFGVRLQSVVSNPSIDSDKKRNAVVALIASPSPDFREACWPLLRISETPQFRTDLIHRLASSNVEPSILIERLRIEPDTSVRRALIQASGEYALNQIPAPSLGPFLQELEALYQQDPDAGIHASIAWVLRHWERGDRVELLDSELVRSGPPRGSRWFAMPNLPTMVLITPPSSVEGEVRKPFLISATEITWRQFLEFKPEHRPFSSRPLPPLDHPVYDVLHHEVLEYCAWLNRQKSGPIVSYRLPTGAEWKLASAAGASTSRHYGDSDDSLGNYAHYLGNADGHVQPVATLKPNDFGLFDTLGNVNELWSDLVEKNGDFLIVIAGGSCMTNADKLKTSLWTSLTPKPSAFSYGFRIVGSPAEQLP